MIEFKKYCVIGLLLPQFFKFDKNIEEVLKGNPGLGGTEYLTLLLAIKLSEIYQISLYSFSSLIVSTNNINNVVISNYNDCLDDINKKEGYIILSPKQIENFYLDYTGNANIIIWVHTQFYSRKKVVDFAKTQKVKSCVFLTKYSYIMYPKEIRRKSAIIPHPSMYNEKFYVNKNKNIIIFLGAVIPLRGLHNLLLVLPKLVKINPNLTLYVCGSGFLHNPNCDVGRHGLADKAYENYLFDIVNKGNIENNVVFMGNISLRDNLELFESAVLGFTNLRYSGDETFCLSAIEMGSFGMPVISGDIDGLKETLPSKCGYRVSNNSELYFKAKKILTNDKLREKKAHNYKCFVANVFDCRIYTTKWSALINSINLNKEINTTSFTIFVKLRLYLFKYLRLTKNFFSYFAFAIKKSLNKKLISK